MQQQYWVTKQVVLQKLGRKEDEHIVASDAELDAKLELFHAIEHTSLMLQKVIELYQDKLLALSQEENCMGRFLKEQGKLDKTRAGKMMSAAGKSLSYTAQQRLSLRVPLVRLYQEVETFRSRAIADTLITVNHMEGLRTDYRGALLWMKDVSQELDPDTYKQLDKFRKVQTQVRRTKTKFDKLKVDCLQKIDLLAASRCNMFSHALAAYQTSLLTFWKKTARTMGGVAESFKGYQHYEFSMLKELTEPSKKLAEETGGHKTDNAEVAEEVDKDLEKDKDKLIFFEEYHDDDEAGEKVQQRTQNGSIETTKKKPADKKEKLSAGSEGSAALLDLDFGEPKDGEEEMTNRLTQSNNTRNKKNKDCDQEDAVKKNAGAVDLLTDQSLLADEDKDDLTLLNEILSIPSGGPETDIDWKSSFGLGTEDSFNPDWQAAFGEKSASADTTDSLQEFLPSQLLDLNLDMGSTTLHPTTAGPSQSSATSSSTAPPKPSPPPSKLNEKQTSQKLPPSKSRKQGKDMSMWFDLFADLDPLANPDAIGKKEGDASEQDRNC